MITNFALIVKLILLVKTKVNYRDDYGEDLLMLKCKGLTEQDINPLTPRSD